MTRKEIIDLYDDLARKSYRPTRKKYKEGHIFDEEKSVRWNREEVARQNQLYEDEVLQLREQEKQDRRDTEEKLYSFLVEEYRLNLNQIQKLYSYAYNEGHAYGIQSVLSLLDDLVDLYEEVRNLE